MRIRGTDLSRWVLGCLCALALAAPPARLSGQPAPDVALQAVIATGLTLPVGLVNAGDGTGRLFVVQQRGQILAYNAAYQLLGTFLDISSLTTCGNPAVGCGEQGLLGLAFHPNYASNGYFFVDYTDANGDEVIARYKVSANPNVANPASATILLTVPDPYPNHNGGQLQFGPDGYLYIAMGDGGAGGDPGNRAQNPGELLGKILRIDVDATGAVPCNQSQAAPYGIPADNPFAGSATACNEVWDYGLRNPWRFSFDPASGDLWIGDVGERLYEEVDFEPSGGAGGVNYGWRRMEGLHCYNPSTGCNDGTLELPILEYPHSPECSVTGGYVYRGSLSPQLYGVYVFGDYCSGKIWGVTRDSAGIWSRRQIASSQFISSFGQDEAGELYVVEHSGAVRRIVGPTSYALPAIAALKPFAAVKGDPPFTLSVDGTGFTPASLVAWNGSARATTYVSRTRLTMTVAASDVAAAGSATVTVSNPSPGGGISAGKSFAVTNMFLDVPLSHLLRRPIEGIADAGITEGCGARLFCPEVAVTRDQMAILLLRASHGSGYAPPAASGTVFGDVAKGDFAAAFIEQLSAEGITAGCGSGNFCPTVPVTRAPMAKFLLKAHDGGGYVPSQPPTGIFGDVAPTDPFAAFIEELSRRGITSGCGGGKYCPNQNVTRAQMAAFLARAFSIPLAP
ncbi:MAG: PQQ-dependent sugar dehydrogenase [Acidobacteriota bacterium]